MPKIKIENPDLLREELQDKRLRRNEELMLLERSSGFSSLPIESQTIIRNSLSIRDRADSAPHIFRKDAENINNWFCHAGTMSAILGDFEKGLEYARLIKDDNETFREFSETDDWISPNRAEDVENILRKRGFPCLVIISYEGTDGYVGLPHSFIALGEEVDESGQETDNIIVWEKKWAGAEYRVTNFEEVFKDNHKGNYRWGTKSIVK